jgi:hypothetical protein
VQEIKKYGKEVHNLSRTADAPRAVCKRAPQIWSDLVNIRATKLQNGGGGATNTAEDCARSARTARNSVETSKSYSYSAKM